MARRGPLAFTVVGVALVVLGRLLGALRSAIGAAVPGASLLFTLDVVVLVLAIALGFLMLAAVLPTARAIAPRLARRPALTAAGGLVVLLAVPVIGHL
jgi:hypothetical protein